MKTYIYIYIYNEYLAIICNCLELYIYIYIYIYNEYLAIICNCLEYTLDTSNATECQYHYYM